MDLSDEILNVSHCLLVAKLWTVKVGGQKKIQTFWVRGYILCSGERENTRENPSAQSAGTLSIHSSAAP